MDVSFCLLCMYNMCMYICIHMLSTVGTGVLICSIIVLYLLYWKKIKPLKNKKQKQKNNNRCCGGVKTQQWMFTPTLCQGNICHTRCTLTFTYTVSFVIAPRLSVVWSKWSVPKACMLFCTVPLNTAFCSTMDTKGSATPLAATA